MSRRPAKFTQADLRRAAKVAKELGVAVEIPTPVGIVRICPLGELTQPSKTDELDRELEAWDARNGHG